MVGLELQAEDVHVNVEGKVQEAIGWWRLWREEKARFVQSWNVVWAVLQSGEAVEP